MRINKKPLSVNEVWQGKRFKTPKYKLYEGELLFTLPKYELPEPPYEVHLTWGFSSSASDWDNPIKPFQDILAKKYGFNDKMIHKGVVTKKQVKKGEEYIEFEILHYDDI